MTPKRSALEDTRSALRDIIDRGEEVVSVFVEELTGSSSLREELEKTLRRANQARKTVDRNVEAVLGALNLPTRRDYAKLVEEIHALQGAVTNLNMKLDRLIALSTPRPEVGSPRPQAAPADVEPTPRAEAPLRARKRPATKRTGKKRATSKRAARG